MVLGNPPVDAHMTKNWVEYSMNFPKPLLGICDQVCDPLWVGYPTSWVTDPSLSVTITTVQLQYRLKLQPIVMLTTSWISTVEFCWSFFNRWTPYLWYRPGGRRLQFRRKEDSSNRSFSTSWLTSLIEFQILPLSKIFDNIRRSKKQFIFFDCLMWCWCKYPLNQKDLILSKIILVSN